MSIYENSVQAFIYVLESKSDLFSTQDWSELNQLASSLSEDVEEIAEEIENWLQPESRSQILQAYEERLKALTSSSTIDLDKNLGPGNTKSPTPPNQPSESSRELLDNAIKKNSSLPDSQPSKQQP
ncbi:hypothetical protein H6G81_05965 [Scytonema hofmannii FACHB-248]|uniref:Uncharacterized protein n=1 Tax=Scytonema hofmannii FACHB-248 TaxID=1842502 RepID=A0ABR8GLJ5_9CYAN|nr:MULTISPECIES: hypothetical protein [Nostocales]MBD2604081.1 hypothetical protein [Scytonema hofmannii FACHB-248]